MQKEKKIPTILGIIIVLFAIATSVFLTKQQTSFRPSASGTCQPSNVQISNITHQSFDVSFTTANACLSSLSILDRTIQNIKQRSKVHHFSINNLSQSTEYSFSLIIDGQVFSNGEYRAVTAKKPSSVTPTSNLAWGRVLNPDLSPAPEAIVYLVIPGSSLLSSVTTQNGNWNISLANSFNEAKDNWFLPPPNKPQEFIVISSDGQVTQITGNTSQSNPVPDIIIGQDYFSSTSSTQPQTGSLETPATSSSQISLTISNPKDGEVVNTQSPQFFGTAPQSSTLKIIVQSPQTIEGQVVSQANGQWSWSPPQKLTPGVHTVTVSVKDPQTGLWQSVSKKFQVSAQSSNLAFSSSSSATLITPTPTRPPQTPTQSAVTPTSTIRPTSAPTSTSTPVPTVRTSKPATDSGVPVTGEATPTMIMVAVSLLFIAVSKYLLKNR